MNSKQLTFEEYLPLMLSGAAALGIIPFAIIRFANGDILIGILDAVLVACLVSLALYSFKTKQTRIASICLAFLCVAGMLATLYLRGASQAFWIYPVLIAVFYLIRRREALLLNAVTVLAAMPALSGTVPSITFLTILITSIVTCAFAYAFATVTRGQRDTLLKLARKDPLTGAGNRRALQEKLSDVTANCLRKQSAASLLILDLDHFKKVNDEFGHAAGDRILIRITEIINLRIRVTDSVYRIGGEEFVIIIDGQTQDQALRLAEKLRTIVEANELAPASSVTISVGVAEHQHGESADNWLRRADTALYKAKDAGRNTTILAA